MIVDGHNDLVLRRWRGEDPRHVDLATAPAAGFAGGFFALFVPSPDPPGDPPAIPYALPLAEPIPTDEARRVAHELADTLESLDVTIARRAADFVPGRVTAIMHLEGADPLDPDEPELEEWYRRGLRSVGLVWSRPNAFAEGVPFEFPGSPDTGPGLTDAGRSLVRRCNRMGILVDLSHLNEAGFWDVQRVSTAPLVATHSNAHALCASTRNLTDAQLDAVRDSGGVVGVNFAVSFLREDGHNDGDTPIAEIVRHVEYMVERMGIDHVALGSDFEGAKMPNELGGTNGLPKLVDALRERFDGEGVERITHRNWLRVLDVTWTPWRRFFAAAGDDPRATLLEALARFDEPGLAVDLGAGTGRDTLELLRRGWRVVAVDAQEEAIARIRERAGANGQLQTVVAPFEEAEWPECDLVNASFSLPFASPSRFDDIWRRIVDSLRPGGRFCGQLFGVRDQWAPDGLVTHTRDQVEELLAAFEVERLDEVEEDGQTATGRQKHWHLFHVVARKR